MIPVLSAVAPGNHKFLQTLVAKGDLEYAQCKIMVLF